ncbi:GNAT family N-acetyltransferase [Blastococcus sp. HT6-30]|uniref:GNAT family N-acetyltransferase n=1 Tax=Blastococcus sp. HT6-30 TaxID=3144843 RepID=UPI00321A0FB2
MIVEPAAWDDPDVRRLTTDRQTEVRGRYDGKEEPGRPPSAADVSVVPVAGMTTRRRSAAEHCALGNGAAVVKRMYVVPAARGRGVSKAVLAGLEDAARARGWTTLRLESGPRQPEAIALYSGAGYRPIGAFGHYVGDPDAEHSLFFEQVLAA